LRQPNPAMGSRITGQVAGVHADTPGYSEKVRHRGPSKNCTTGPRVFPEFYVSLNHLATVVYVVPVQAGSVINILLDNPKVTRRRVVTFPASRYDGDADHLLALVKVGSLTLQVYLYARVAHHSVTVPIGDAFLSPL